MRVVARPIHLDKRAIALFVEHDLMPQIHRRALRHSKPDDPIGATRGWASSLLTIDAADGRDSVNVPVSVESEASRASFVAVLGGKSNPNTGVTLYVNGALTPRDLASDERNQPISSCRHESCLPYGLYSILLHEATHVAERALPSHRKAPGYSPRDVEESGEAAYGPYVNDPQEVRAFLQQIVDEVVHNAKSEDLRGHFERDPHPNRALVDTALALSTTYSIIEKHLTPSNRARILKAVYEAMDRQGLLYDRTARLVARYLSSR